MGQELGHGLFGKKPEYTEKNISSLTIAKKCLEKVKKRSRSGTDLSLHFLYLFLSALRHWPVIVCRTAKGSVGMEEIVMLVEDEIMFGTEQIRKAFYTAGFMVKSVNMLAAEQAIKVEKPALMVVNLAGKLQPELEDCARLVKWSGRPLIAIGPSGEDAFRNAILESAADDYLTRPVNPIELAARAKNIWLRAQMAVPGGMAYQAELDADPATNPRPPGEALRQRFRKWLCRIFGGK
jgi:PleD family two-component response regulator